MSERPSEMRFEEEVDALIREHLVDGAEVKTNELYRSIDLIAGRSDKVCIFMLSQFL